MVVPCYSLDISVENRVEYPSIKRRYLINCGSGLWCLTPLSAIFQLYRGSKFFGGGNMKTTDLPQVTVKLYHIILYQVHFTMSGIQTHNFTGDMH